MEVEAMWVRRAAIIAVLTSCVPLASAGPLQDDLKARRGRLAAQLTPQSLSIVWSAPTRVYSLDVDYEYRQDSNLLYLTGINQPGTTLVLMPGNKTQREILFISEPNPAREHREGHILTREEATAASGIAAVYYAGQLEPFLAAMFGRTSFGDPKFAEAGEYETFFAGVAAGRASLALPLGPPPQASAPLGTAYEFANKARERYFGVAIADTWPVLSNLRQVKTPYELTVLEQSAAISSDAHLAGMRAARPGRYEYEVEAEIERTYLSRGAMSWGYPSIVGSGPNATILHYESSSRQMQDGDLLLVDAAAKAGNKTADITKAAADVAKAGLLKLGLITDASGEQYRTWYTHGIIHWIGMDVHDVGDYDRPLASGMTFVIEPGLYIRPQALDTLPDTPENRAFKAAVGPAVAKYSNIGVRVEDSFALTDTGLRTLSAKVPKTIEDVERTLAQPGTRSSSSGSR